MGFFLDKEESQGFICIPSSCLYDEALMRSWKKSGFQATIFCNV
jgi:hypothetical protein